jgi:hypothetical protein
MVPFYNDLSTSNVMQLYAECGIRTIILSPNVVPCGNESGILQIVQYYASPKKNEFCTVLNIVSQLRKYLPFCESLFTNYKFSWHVHIL